MYTLYSELLILTVSTHERAKILLLVLFLHTEIYLSLETFAKKCSSKEQFQVPQRDSIM